MKRHSERQRKALNTLAKAMLAGRRLVAADIGASGDIPAPWIALEGSTRFLCVEPDESAIGRMRNAYEARHHARDYEVHNVALTGDGRPRTLYLTASRGGSSLFNPDNELIRRYTSSEYLFPIEIRTIPTEAADSFFRSIGRTAIDIMKLDVQGCELEILQALPPETMNVLTMVELEAAMLGRGAGYPSFCDINGFMTAQGFELLDVWPDRQPRALNGNRTALTNRLGVYAHSPSVARRIWEVDALYFRSPAQGASIRDEAALRVLLVCMCAYGFFTEAIATCYDAVDLGIIDDATRASLEPLMVQWHAAARFRPWFSMRWPWPIVRQLAAVADFLVPHSGADYIHKRRY